mgnify:CR=1 FL=1
MGSGACVRIAEARGVDLVDLTDEDLEGVDKRLRPEVREVLTIDGAVASRAKTGRGLTTVPIFLLVPQVKLRKRLDLARDAERAIHGVPGRIVAGWVSL